MKNQLLNSSIAPKRDRFLLTLALFLCYQLSWSQEAISVSGGNIVNTSGSVSLTLGQPFFNFISASAGSASEGVQQAYGVRLISENQETINFRLTCSVFPNPVVDNLTLRVDPAYMGQVGSQLITGDGKLIESKEIVTNETSFYMGNLAPGVYYLRLLEANSVEGTNRSTTLLKTFKIIKAH